MWHILANVVLAPLFSGGDVVFFILETGHGVYCIDLGSGSDRYSMVI